MMMVVVKVVDPPRTNYHLNHYYLHLVVVLICFDHYDMLSLNLLDLIHEY